MSHFICPLLYAPLFYILIVLYNYYEPAPVCQHAFNLSLLSLFQSQSVEARLEQRQSDQHSAIAQNSADLAPIDQKIFVTLLTIFIIFCGQSFSIVEHRVLLLFLHAVGPEFRVWLGKPKTVSFIVFNAFLCFCVFKYWSA